MSCSEGLVEKAEAWQEPEMRCFTSVLDKLSDRHSEKGSHLRLVPATADYVIMYLVYLVYLRRRRSNANQCPSSLAPHIRCLMLVYDRFVLAEVGDRWGGVLISTAVIGLHLSAPGRRHVVQAKQASPTISLPQITA